MGAVLESVPVSLSLSEDDSVAEDVAVDLDVDDRVARLRVAFLLIGMPVLPATPLAPVAPAMMEGEALVVAVIVAFEDGEPVEPPAVRVELADGDEAEASEEAAAEEVPDDDALPEDEDPPDREKRPVKLMLVSS